jgi:hypothetical protein
LGAAASAAVAFPRSVAITQTTTKATAGGGGGLGRKGGRALRQGERPTKICATCGLPFEYRKKWEKVWDDVKYCSERCRRSRRAGGDEAPSSPA